MSFFGRGVLVVAAVAAVAHVFRRDLARLLPALQRPAAAFLADVRAALRKEVAAADAADAAQPGARIAAAPVTPPTVAAAPPPAAPPAAPPPLR